MTLMMEIECGTYKPEKFEIDLDKYGESVPQKDKAAFKKAFDLLRATMNDRTFADDHYRNEDAVNGCIALHVMGFEPESWFENFCAEQGEIKDRWWQEDLDKFMEHVERVSPYVSVWGPNGNEARALDFAI